MAVDWLAIKTEYINGGISYRKLAEKYEVSFNTLQDRAKRENWKEERDGQHDKITTKSRQKTVEKISDALSDAAVDEATARAELRAGLFRLAADWVKSQKKIEDTNDFRRMVQSCCDLMALEAPDENGVSNDGLLEALGKNAASLFDDGDDSGMLPDEEDDTE